MMSPGHSTHSLFVPGYLNPFLKLSVDVKAAFWIWHAVEMGLRSAGVGSYESRRRIDRHDWVGERPRSN